MNQISDELKRLITPTDRMLKLIWVGQFASFGIYVFIAFHTVRAESGTEPQQLIYVMSALAIASAVASLVFRRFLLSPDAVGKFLNDNMPAFFSGILKTMLSRKPLGSSRLADDTEQKLFTYASVIFNLQLIQWGMLNTTAIFGMMLALLFQKSIIVLFFVIPVAVIILTEFPNVAKLLEAGVIEKELGPART